MVLSAITSRAEARESVFFSTAETLTLAVSACNWLELGRPHSG